jgi:hypothetical protein
LIGSFNLQERGEEKLLALKKEMAALVASKADEMSRRAEEAWEDVKAAGNRLKTLRKQVLKLKETAQTKRLASIYF